MKFNELKIGSYHRDRSKETSYLDFGEEFAYFEELYIYRKDENEMVLNRTHIYFLNNGGIEETEDRGLKMGEEAWDSSWKNLEFITKGEMNRRVIKYFFTSRNYI